MLHHKILENDINMALHGGMSSVVRRMKVLNATVHGFRSTFRDYIGEETQLEPRIAEYCLAHKVGDATERAYARGDLGFQKE